MGELHLDVLVTRIFREFKVEARVGKPQVSYRETISAEVTHVEKYHRMIAGKEHSATITIKVTPLPRGQGNSFTLQARRRTRCPKSSCRGGARRNGGLRFRCRLRLPRPRYRGAAVDAEYHQITSTAIAFEARAPWPSTRRAARQARSSWSPSWRWTCSAPPSSSGR